MIRIALASVMVSNQETAFQFYTEKLGFIKKRDIPMGEHRWLTVVGPGEQDGTELVLEPLGFEPARVFQQELKKAGIPATAFQVEDLQKEYERLISLGVEFSMSPTAMGPTSIAVLDDTCGNNIQLFQML